MKLGDDGKATFKVVVSEDLGPFGGVTEGTTEIVIQQPEEK